jgi:chorismate mutase
MKTISRSKVQRKKDSAGWMTIYCTGALVVVFLLWWCLHQYVSSTILNSVKESKSLFRAIATIKKQSESISDSISESKLIENIRYQENRLANIFKSGNNDLRIEPPRIKHHSDKLKVAFAITMTKDGSFQDGAAVLAYSIYNSKMTFDCDVSLVAFVHPNVSTSRSVLSKLGYHVIEVPTPVK